MNIADEKATEIVGTYVCEGGDYRGQVVIRDLNDSFAIHWTISGAVHAGVGIRLGNSLAVSVAVPTNAVVLYDIQPGPLLQGRFCAMAGTPVRNEVLSYSAELRTWEMGDSVLANWSQDPFWYPASVTAKADDDRYLVCFADGDEEWASRSRLMPDLLTVGDIVYHTQGLLHRDESGQRAWTQMDPNDLDTTRITLPARIIGREDESVTIQYEDEVSFKTKIEFVRTLAPREG